MRTNLLLFATILFVVWSAFADAFAQTTPPKRTDEERFLQARVWLSDSFSLQDAEETGVEVEHSVIKGKRFVEGVISYYTLSVLQGRGVKVEILEADAETQAARRLGSFAQKLAKQHSMLTSETPRNFTLGSMGGFFTLDEVYAEFARMRTMFPQVMSALEVIGTSVEGRPLLAYRVGTEQSLSSKAPEILYTGLHHAREPGSVSTLIYYLWWLLEKFQANDPEAVYLLNNRQMYFVPMVNPDGYQFNQTSFPGGGGMWRKNRQRNSDGSFGVDLNRNYGTQTFWNAPNSGSSTSTRSDTYRGTEPFSEPETQAVRDFCLRHNFRTAINYHSYSNLLIYPYSYVNTETPDSTYFRALTAEITKNNLYSAGRDLQTVGYAVRGASDDWMYAGVSGRKIMAYTPEIGTTDDGFYPTPDRITAHGAENLSTNRMTAWSAAVNLRPVQSYVTENPQTGLTRIIVEIQNIGIQDAASSSAILLRPLARGVGILRAERPIRALRSTELVLEAFDCTFDSTVKNGSTIPMEILITQENTPRRDTMQAQVLQANRQALFATETDASQWKLGRWSVVRDALTGRTALTDSPTGNYPANARNYVQLAQPVSLRNVRAATLEFQTRWSIESNADIGVAQVSTDNGATWQTLRTSLMKPSSFGSGANFGFDGNFPQWIRQECSLQSVLGQDILVRFGLLSDSDAQFDGFFLSDIAMRIYRDSLATTSTTLLAQPRLSPNTISAGDDLRIEFPLSNETKADIRFYNVLGQTLFAADAVQIASDGIAALRLPTLARGLYFVEIHTTSRTTKTQLMVL